MNEDDPLRLERLVRRLEDQVRHVGISLAGVGALVGILFGAAVAGRGPLRVVASGFFGTVGGAVGWVGGGALAFLVGVLVELLRRQARLEALLRIDLSTDHGGTSASRESGVSPVRRR